MLRCTQVLVEHAIHGAQQWPHEVTHVLGRSLTQVTGNLGTGGFGHSLVRLQSFLDVEVGIDHLLDLALGLELEVLHQLIGLAIQTRQQACQSIALCCLSRCFFGHCFRYCFCSFNRRRLLRRLHFCLWFCSRLFNHNRLYLGFNFRSSLRRSSFSFSLLWFWSWGWLCLSSFLFRSRLCRGRSWCRRRCGSSGSRLLGCSRAFQCCPQLRCNLRQLHRLGAFTSQGRELLQQVVIGGRCRHRFIEHTLGKVLRIAAGHVGIQASSGQAPFVLRRDPVLVLAATLGWRLQVLSNSSILVAHSGSEVAQLHHLLSSSLPVAADDHLGHFVGVLHQRWVLGAILGIFVECHLSGHSIDCSTGIPSGHGFHQSLCTLQANALHRADLNLARGSQSQGVVKCLSRQCLRGVLSTHHHFWHRVQRYRCHGCRLAQLLGNHCPSLGNLLGAFHIRECLEDARQVSCLY